MSNYTRNDKTISNKISKKHERSYNDHRIIIPLGLLIRETTQRILPSPPQLFHDLILSLFLNGVLRSYFRSCFNFCKYLIWSLILKPFINYQTKHVLMYPHYHLIYYQYLFLLSLLIYIPNLLSQY